MRWTVLIPAKALPAAKSRLLPATADESAHRSLVQAIRADTEAAARLAEGVARVLVVVDRPGVHGDGEFVQTRPGLNGALTDAAEYAATTWPDDGIAALQGDLPALRPADLAAALSAAVRHHRSYVPDADGAGTTLLAATPGTDLDPRFGRGSAARHGEAAVRLDAGESLRTDVDTVADLAAATGLGLGPHTAAVVSTLDPAPVDAVHLDVG